MDIRHPASHAVPSAAVAAAALGLAVGFLIARRRD